MDHRLSHGMLSGCNRRSLLSVFLMILPYLRSSASQIRAFALSLLVCSGVCLADPHPLGDLAPRNTPDGVLDLGDLLVLHSYVNGAFEPSPNELLIGDVAPLPNGDGVLDAADVLILERAISGHVLLGDVTLPPPPPSIPSFGSGFSTTDNPFNISGMAEQNATVYIYINGVLQHQTEADVNGGFQVDLYLFDGDNEIYAI